MDQFEQLYGELIMEHAMNSHNKRGINSPTCSSLGHNPSCGDKISLEAKIENGKIVDMGFSGEGCAISQSSTSMMIDLLKGKSVDQAKQLIEIFLKMIKRESVTQEEKKLLKNARVFENVSNMPSRAKCATLSWHTLEDLLNKLNNN
ncbi:MAG: SUF system NifU family Fe-S cluster assembly protein [Clostridia bacterium]|nr:SUF system NifU family Fe-S cluster assembly protein [Clostridia bacterium]